ncbi:hypothetical protein M0R72_06390 [Candidatus Pacearchaeota archaeon]|jgi:hypothetical protein|nr:hypothetical protein [Candidatus Pacearchaeota archaeon]
MKRQWQPAARYRISLFTPLMLHHSYWADTLAEIYDVIRYLSPRWGKVYDYEHRHDVLAWGGPVPTANLPGGF